MSTADDISPRVFISYAHDDGAHEELVRGFWRFLRANGIDAMLDVTQPRSDWAAWVAGQITNAQYVLVIASPEYPRQPGDSSGSGTSLDWEAALIRQRLLDSAAGLREVLPVVLPGGSVSDLPAWLIPTGTLVYQVSEFTATGAEPLLRVLMTRPLDVEAPTSAANLRITLTPESPAGGATPPADYRLSDSVLNVLNLARAMAGGRPVDASVVLLAVLHYTHDADHAGGVTRALFNELTARRRTKTSDEELLARLDHALMDAGLLGPTALPLLDPRLIADVMTASMSEPPLSLLLGLAADAARRTLGKPEVHLRHLVFATVVASDPPLHQEMLRAMEVSAEELRALVGDAARVLGNRSEDSGEAWQELLPPVSAAWVLAGGIDADLVDPTRGIPLDRDDLGLGVWVSMLAAVIVDERTPMPLSLGIFGEWGSGKSYFMGLLRSEIERLSRVGRGPYLRDVVQIGFNAWHYADANLWASLGDEIFRQLAGPAGTADESRRELQEKLAEGAAERQALEARTEQARAETVRLQAELEDAMAQRSSEAVGLLEAARSAGFGKRLDKVWRRIGIRDQTQRARLFAAEVRGAAAPPSPLRSVLARPRTWIFAGIGLVALVALAAAAWLPASWTNWLAGAGAAALVTAVTSVVTLLTQAGQGLGQLKAIATQLSNDLAAPDEQAPPGVQEAVGRLREAEAAEKVAQAQLDEVVTQVGQLARQLSDLMPGQRLYAFLAERAASGPYAGQLGLISTIRKDFEHLVELLRDWHREPGPGDAPRPIDRIVLYIDDLDRCRPRQVVEVLQAVHLLLALDLFVVVVGVDPRWLVRSLQHQFRDNIDTESDAVATADEPWNVTPRNYLEKIFNIPFALQGIPAGALGRVLRSMAHAAAAGDQPGTGPVSTDPGRAGADGPGAEAGPAGFDAFLAGAVPIEEGSEIAASYAGSADVPPRPLTEPELAFLSALEPLVATPREAKRLFNLYRMLRATRDLSEASTFLGDQYTPGEYQAVATLLGMLTANAELLEKVIAARPRHSPETAGGLAWRPANGNWREFAGDLDPVRPGDGGWFNPIIGRIPDGEVQAWRQFAVAAAALDGLIALPDLTAFQRWAPRIRQFSFTLATPSAQPPFDERH